MRGRVSYFGKLLLKLHDPIRIFGDEQFALAPKYSSRASGAVSSFPKVQFNIIPVVF